MSTITLSFKVSGGDQFSIDIDPEKTVLECKQACVEKNSSFNVDTMKLIYKGKILKNPDSLKSVGVENGHMLHVVKGAGATPAAAPAAAPAAGDSNPAPAANPTPNPAANPFGMGAPGGAAPGGNPFAAMLGGGAGGAPGGGLDPAMLAMLGGGAGGKLGRILLFQPGLLNPLETC